MKRIFYSIVFRREGKKLPIKNFIILSRGWILIIGDKFICKNCGRKVEKDEKMAIIATPKKLNGWTLLNAWGPEQVIYCSRCFSELE